MHSLLRVKQTSGTECIVKELLSVVPLNTKQQISYLFYQYVWGNSSDKKGFVFCLFDLILYVPSTIFQIYGTGLPGLNQY